MKRWIVGLVLLTSVVSGSGVYSLNQQALGTLDQGLVAHWPFDEQEGDIIFDASGDHNDAGIVGAIWNEQGDALRFDGEAYVFVPHAEGIMPREAISLAAWVQILGKTSAYHGVVGKGGYGSGYRLLIQQGSGKVLFQLTGKAGYNLWSTQTISDNQWHFLVATYDGKQMRIYLDGQVDPAEKERAGPIDANTAPLMIGRPQYGFNGLLDEVRIYNRALSKEEVQTLFELGR